MTMRGNTRLQLFLVVLIIGFLAGPRVIKALDGLQPEKEKPIAVETPAPSTSPAQPKKAWKNPFAELSLEAKSVYVWDINMRRKLYSQNGEIRLPLASVAKVMTALVASEILSPEAKIVITPADVLGEGDTGLAVGEIWKFEKLRELALVASSNDGMGAIAATAGGRLAAGTSTIAMRDKGQFIEKMNERARAIGLNQTSFQNENGLDLGGGVSGAYGSARDMAMLFEYVFRKHPKIFTSTSYGAVSLRSESNILHHITNTNQNVEHIAGIIGSKTGYTDLAGGNLVVIVDIGIDHPVVIAVLGSTREGRFTDVQKLIDATIETITQKNQ